MKCALFCIQKLSEYYQFDSEDICKCMQTHLNHKGISLYDLMQCLQKCNLHFEMGYHFFIPTQLPCMILLRPKRGGHFVLVLKQTKWKVTLWEERRKTFTISKIRLYVFYSRICIICYNEKRNKENLW